MSYYTENGLLEKIINLYQKGHSIDTLSIEFNIPKRSLITKLSLEGVYKRQRYLDKNGNIPVKKDLLAEKLGRVLNLDPNQEDCLTNCTKPVLMKILECLEEHLLHRPTVTVEEDHY